MQENAEGEGHDVHSSEEGSSSKVRGGVRSLRIAGAELGIIEFGGKSAGEGRREARRAIGASFTPGAPPSSSLMGKGPTPLHHSIRNVPTAVKGGAANRLKRELALK